MQRLLASNIVGNSAYSAVGNGAVIITKPDSPINLINDLTVSTMT